ncbi:coiled-coil domain-containing protein [Helicobacter labacensis]|uniref:hypothetical protein n=1 Tax=Helicobacter labacensis TaxID=2316079 RepID=UPI001968BF88|nr:hypothetical protein [Helicobacter labacensis]
MGGISSIHFKQTKNKVQAQHNDRTIEPSYLLPKVDVAKVGGGIEVNRNADQAEALKNAIVSKAMQDYQEHVGQRFQAKSYLWSAVVNIKPDTTMQDLEKLATHFKTKYGFQCYQIAIHRDEGHVDDEGNTRINHHAHLEFVMLDEHTGKSLFRKTTPRALRQIQTETADILGMQRGVDVRKSGAKRIEPRAYGKLMEQERAKQIEIRGESQSWEAIARELFRFCDTLNAILSAWIPKGKMHYTGSIKLLTEKAREVQDQLGNTQQQLNTAQQENTTLQSTNATLTQEKQTLQGHNTELEATIKQLETSNTELTTQLNELIAIVAPTDKKLTSKELKALKEQARKQMIVVNNLLSGEEKLFTKEDYASLRALGADNLESGVKEIANKATKRLADQQRALADLKTQLSVSQADNALKDKQIVELTQQNVKAGQELEKLKEVETALAKLKIEHETLQTKEQEYQQTLELKDSSIRALDSENNSLTQEYQELKDNQIELESTLIDLATIFAPQDKQDKKLTIKEVKPLIESVRKQMIAINQGLGDLKLFTQEDYKALRALKDEGLSIADLKKRIATIEKEAKERYQALQE